MLDLSQKIYEKLKSITVFAPEFKQEVYNKLTALEREKLLVVDNILSEVLAWEQAKKDKVSAGIAASAEELAKQDQEKIAEIKKLISNL